MTTLLRALAVLLVLSGAVLPARAYVDPTSGGLVIQLIVGALVGAGLALKLGWQRIKALFGRLFHKGDAEE